LTGKTNEHPFERVLFYLEPAPQLRGGTAPATAPAPVMRQNDGAFVPHVLPIVAGTTVSFPNEDPVYHNVFSLTRGNDFDLGRYKKGSTKTRAFDKPAVVQVFCHIHSDMSAYIVVLENPFYVVPDAQGKFAIENVPAGEYTLVIWHERIRPVKQAVSVKAGATTPLNLRVPILETAKPR
jgi:plastocyanin